MQITVAALENRVTFFGRQVTPCSAWLLGVESVVHRRADSFGRANKYFAPPQSKITIAGPSPLMFRLFDRQQSLSLFTVKGDGMKYRRAKLNESRLHRPS